MGLLWRTSAGRVGAVEWGRYHFTSKFSAAPPHCRTGSVCQSPGKSACALGAGSESAPARILPEGGCRVLFLDGIMERGCDLFAEICRRDLEGHRGEVDARHVSKREHSQMVDWHELFAAGRADSRRTLPKAATLALV